MKLLKLTKALGHEYPYYININRISSFCFDGTHTVIFMNDAEDYVKVEGDITVQLARMLSTDSEGRFWTL